MSDFAASERNCHPRTLLSFTSNTRFEIIMRSLHFTGHSSAQLQILCTAMGQVGYGDLQLVTSNLASPLVLECPALADLRLQFFSLLLPCSGVMRRLLWAKKKKKKDLLIHGSQQG